MGTSRALVWLSAAQLAAGVAGQVLALHDQRSFRGAFTATGRDPVVTPVAAAGFGLAFAMAVSGLGAPTPCSSGTTGASWE